MSDVTILLVDDEADLLALTSTYLRKIGYATLLACDGQSALNLIADGSPRIDLLITDIIMPGGMNGIELGRQFAILCPGVPIIYTSGYISRTLQMDIDSLTPERMLTKPYRLRQLVAIIHDALTQKRRAIKLV